MGFLLSDIRIWLVIAAAAAFAGLAVEHQRAERYQVERNTARSEIAKLVAAVESKDGVIADVTTALQKWQDKATESAKASTEAGERAATYQTQLSAARSRLRALTEIDRGNPKCEALLEIDLGAVCAGHADRVRSWVTPNE